MSGGHFDYKQHAMTDIAEELEQDIQTNFNGWKPETIAKFLKTEQMLRLVYKMVHEVDWLMSGDSGEQSFTEEWESQHLDDVKLVSGSDVKPEDNTSIVAKQVDVKIMSELNRALTWAVQLLDQYEAERKAICGKSSVTRNYCNSVLELARPHVQHIE